MVNGKLANFSKTYSSWKYWFRMISHLAVCQVNIEQCDLLYLSNQNEKKRMKSEQKTRIYSALCDYLWFIQEIYSSKCEIVRSFFENHIKFIKNSHEKTFNWVHRKMFATIFSISVRNFMTHCTRLLCCLNEWSIKMLNI